MLDAIVEDAEKNHVVLDENLSFARTGGLVEAIVSETSKSLYIDASQVRHLDAPCAQILLAAKSHYTASDLSFEYSTLLTNSKMLFIRLGCLTVFLPAWSFLNVSKRPCH